MLEAPSNIPSDTVAIDVIYILGVNIADLHVRRTDKTHSINLVIHLLSAFCLSIFQFMVVGLSLGFLPVFLM